MNLCKSLTARQAALRSAIFAISPPKKFQYISQEPLGKFCWNRRTTLRTFAGPHGNIWPVTNRRVKLRSSFLLGGRVLNPLAAAAKGFTAYGTLDISAGTERHPNS